MDGTEPEQELLREVPAARIGLNQSPAAFNQLCSEEAEAARTLRAWMEAFIDFPTADNWNGVAKRMQEYQTAWMNGRTRTMIEITIPEVSNVI